MQKQDDVATATPCRIDCKMVTSAYQKQPTAPRAMGLGSRGRDSLSAKPRDPKSPRPPPKTLHLVIYSDDHTHFDFSMNRVRL